MDRIGPTLASVLDFSGPAPAIVILGSGPEPDAEALILRIREQTRPEADTRFVLLEDSEDPVLPGGLASLVDAILPKNMPSEALGHFLEIVSLGQQVFLARRKLWTGHSGSSGGAIQDQGPGPTESDPKSGPDWPACPDGGTSAPVYPVLNGTGNGASSYKHVRAHSGQISLSDRELEILQCLKVGAPNKVIARTLQITESTVKVHIKSLLKKMRVKNRTQAAVWASEALLGRQIEVDPCQTWFPESADAGQSFSPGLGL